MKRRYLFFLTLFFLANYSFACSCIEEKSSLNTKVKNAYFSSNLIFTGQVITIKSSENSSLLEVVFEVETLIKGTNINRKVSIFTEQDDGVCGFSFKKRKKYLVYSHESKEKRKKNSFEYHKVPPFNETDICTRTANLQSVKKCELRKLNRLAKKEQ